MSVPCILGVDPGLKGAIAFYFPDAPDRVSVFDMPVVAGEVRKLKAQHAPLEKSHDRGRRNKGINDAVRELGIDRTEAQHAVKVASLSDDACARVLRWEEIPCEVRDSDDLFAELIMIDENLCRVNLGPAEEAYQIGRRKEIYEALHPGTKAESFKGNRHTGSLAADNLSVTSFASDTAHQTGRDERSVRRDAARGEALGESLKLVAGTSLDKGVELDALMKLPQSEREDLMARAQKGETVSARVGSLALRLKRGSQEEKQCLISRSLMHLKVSAFDGAFICSTATVPHPEATEAPMKPRTLPELAVSLPPGDWSTGRPDSRRPLMESLDLSSAALRQAQRTGTRPPTLADLDRLMIYP